MKKFIQNIIFVLFFTIIILFFYSVLEHKVSSPSLTEFYHFLFRNDSKKKAGEENPQEQRTEGENEFSYRAVWLSYLEFNSFRETVKQNNEQTFRAFYEHILNRCEKYGFNHILVQVRPFGDALYPSDYFPWAACISGKQGENPGYDPLKIMVELTHERGMKFEAWINPYRVSAGESIEELSGENPARIWASDAKTKRNVLKYENALYYNPSMEEVQNLIKNGVKEIVTRYAVDGIHMDDYFYPSFNENNVDTSFDAREYILASTNHKLSSPNISIADWRRENVNQLVSGIYQTIKTENQNITFGISPAGNLSNLRSNLEYYVDIDTWLHNTGYVDYLMPQIYWGFMNEQAPFDQTLEQWVRLAEKSPVTLYVGLQLYRMGSTETGQSDYKELQDSKLIKKELNYMKDKNVVQGYCFFSYQYLDANCKKYTFDSCEFSKDRKKILDKISSDLIKDFSNYSQNDTLTQS